MNAAFNVKDVSVSYDIYGLHRMCLVTYECIITCHGCIHKSWYVWSP